MRQVCFFILFSMLCVTVVAQNGFSIKEDTGKKEVQIFYNNKMLTAYCYYDSSRKPVLFPVNTISGITVTRGFPFQPRTGDRTDHPHHTGIWMNYESVNGLDFWNNSTAIPLEKRHQYGTILHQAIKEKSADLDKAYLIVTATWISPDKKVLLDEETKYLFSITGSDFFIDRITTLKSGQVPVIFKDVKDGFFAIRVARELEMPSKESSGFIDDKGNITKVPASGTDVTGMYVSSTGMKGDDVWGTKATWAMLSGKLQNKNISIAIFDHPANPGFPAYWHARGYGLFSINPLGRKIFTNGKEELNLSLQPGTSTTFRYRVLIHEGRLPDTATLNRIADEFARQVQ